MGFLSSFVLLAFILGTLVLALPQASSTSLEASPTTSTTSLSPTASCMLACKNSDASCQAACLGIPTSIGSADSMISVWTWESQVSSTLGNEEPVTTASDSPTPQNSTTSPASPNSNTGIVTQKEKLSAGDGAGIGIACVTAVFLAVIGLWCWRAQIATLKRLIGKRKAQTSRNLTLDTTMGLYTKPELPGESSPTLLGEKMLEMQANEIPAHEVQGSSPEVHELPA